MTGDQGRYSWRMVQPGRPLELHGSAGRRAGPGEVLVEVAGCGVCHTDVGFYDGSVRTRADLPLVLGHEVSGTVVEAGEGAGELVGSGVLVAAVIPCGCCQMCSAGRGNVCGDQLMPGNDLDGGFATHLTVPATGVFACGDLPAGYGLADMAVVADALTTPLQAIRRAGVAEGDTVVVVGTGGVGGFAVQVAAASGGTVVALDVDDGRLAALDDHGAAASLNVRGMSPRGVREAVRELVASLGASEVGWKVFECSGTASGQETAFGLVGTAATLAVVGFTRDKVSIRLSNLMAFDATAFGSWGCPPERYPEAIHLVTSGQVDLLPFIRRVPMADVMSVLAPGGGHGDPRRPVLVP